MSQKNQDTVSLGCFFPSDLPFQPCLNLLTHTTQDLQNRAGQNTQTDKPADRERQTEGKQRQWSYTKLLFEEKNLTVGFDSVRYVYKAQCARIRKSGGHGT